MGGHKNAEAMKMNRLFLSVLLCKKDLAKGLTGFYSCHCCLPHFLVNFCGTVSYTENILVVAAVILKAIKSDLFINQHICYFRFSKEF